MSYPRTPQDRLIKLYGWTLTDLNKVFEDCGGDKIKYAKKLQEIDTALAASVFAQISDPNFLLH